MARVPERKVITPQALTAWAFIAAEVQGGLTWTPSCIGTNLAIPVFQAW